ncbi:GHKL domain-containing protein, partial [Acinetobacter baumannii]|nr:GHKL domain-containing protein [Acinetobacter baumannii]
PNEKQVTVLVTVLGNLIENALDGMSGQAEGEIGLLLHYQDGWLSGEVSDDGPGIPQSQRRAVFDRGQRADTLRPGQGVGLSVAREIVEQYDGE